LVEKFIGTRITLPSFKLFQRAKHVFKESHLVEQFFNIARQSPHPNNLAPALGDLMNQSHYSCRDLFECSCSELDELTQLSRDSGALGARLTGAGWGGCTVSMVPSDKVDSFLAKIRAGYYNKRFPSLSDEQISEFLFATTPCPGAFVHRK
jgi:galactokinase